MKDRIKNLLVAGLKSSEIATIVGCSPSYVSQLLKDEDFQREVEAGKIANAQERSEEEHLETRYLTTKHKILNAIEENIPHSELPALVRALEVVDKVEDNAKRRKMPAPSTGVINGNIHITNISLPAHVLSAPVPIVQMNDKQEIIAIDAQPLAPMSADGVKNIFAQLKDRKLQHAIESKATADASNF